MTESILPLINNTPNTKSKESDGFEEWFPNAMKAYDLFRKAYAKRNMDLRRKPVSKKHFAGRYLRSMTNEMKQKKYLEKMLPNLSLQERMGYVKNIYCCRFCDRYFPLWYVSHAEWEKTGKQFERLIWTIAGGFENELPEFRHHRGLRVVKKDGRFEYEEEKHDNLDFDGIRQLYEEFDREYSWMNRVWKQEFSGLFLCKECYEKLFNPEPDYISAEEYERELPGRYTEEPPQAYFDWREKNFSVIWNLPALKV
jgi:hypothetical protein